MNAPTQFVLWMSQHEATDHKHGRRGYRYHPRSDFHSRRLCEFVLDDLLLTIPLLAEHALSGIVVGGVNARHTFANGKTKTLDLAIGLPAGDPNPPLAPTRMRMDKISTVRISIEAKQCMTEHSKTKPRLFDELSSSHEIVHQGNPESIACGIVVVNIAEHYASPTRQVASGQMVFTKHQQPAAAAGMVGHLRGLQRRSNPGEVGFDAFATVVIDCDNIGPCSLRTDPPAPQPGDLDHYDRFIAEIGAAYSARFA